MCNIKKIILIKLRMNDETIEGICVICQIEHTSGTYTKRKITGRGMSP